MMLWFIAISATLNLCAGYVIGARVGWLPTWLGGRPDWEGGDFSMPKIGLPSLKRRAKTEEPEAAVEPEEAPPEVAEKTEPDPAPADASESAKPSTKDVLEGLAAFQAQLKDLGNELNETEEDAAFDDCCERVQQANHEYLDHASEAVEQLEGDEEAAPVRDAVKAGAEEVKKASDEFDATMASEDKDEDVRELLRNLAGTLVDAAESAEEGVKKAEAGTMLSPLAVDPATSLATLDSTMTRLDALLEDAVGKPPLIVATVQPDNPKEGEFTPEAAESLLARIGELVSKELGEAGPPAVYQEKQLLVLLPGDSIDEASKRMERIRQQVEATTFLDGDNKHSLTLSCGMAQSGADVDREQIEELLSEALAEAHRYGGNRACHHDGKFPAPVMPEEVDVKPETVKL